MTRTAAERLRAPVVVAGALVLPLGLVLGTMVAGRAGAAVAVFCAQVATAKGLFDEAALPDAVPPLAVVLLAALAGDLVLLGRNPDSGVGPLVGIVSAGFLVVLLLQMVRRPPRTRLTETVTCAAGALVVTGGASLWLVADLREASSGALLAVAAGGAAAACLAVAVGLLARAGLILVGLPVVLAGPAAFVLSRLVEG